MIWGCRVGGVSLVLKRIPLLNVATNADELARVFESATRSLDREEGA